MTERRGTDERAVPLRLCARAVWSRRRSRYDCAETKFQALTFSKTCTEEMSEATTDTPTRRVLLVSDKGTELDSLRERLSAAGYAADSSDIESVIPFCTDEEFEPRAPAAVLLVFGEREGEGRLV